MCTTKHVNCSAYMHVYLYIYSMYTVCPKRISRQSSQRSFLLPVFVFDDSIHNFLHLLCEGRGIRGEFLGRRSSPLSLPLPIFISVPSSSAGWERGGTREIQVAVPLPLAGRLFGTYLFLHLLQRALLYRLQKKDRQIQIIGVLIKKRESILFSRKQ